MSTRALYQAEHHANRSVHAQRVARWLGAELAEHIARQTAGFPHPIAVASVPGRVWAYNGDFVGVIKAGQFGSLADYTRDRVAAAVRRAARRQGGRLHAGFASLSDLITEATTGGKKQVCSFMKVGVAAPAVGASQITWRLAGLPTAGGNAAAPPVGTAFTRTSAGALKQDNPTVGGDTLHFINGWMASNAAQMTSLLLIDYLWAAAFQYNTTSAQPATGVPTRYTTAALAPGNFLGGNVTTALGATPANLTLTYVDDAGNAAEAGTAQAVRISSAVDTSPFTAPDWYYRLNAGDRGVQKLTSFVLSASMGSGVVDRFIGHPIAILPGIGASNQPMFVDGINSAFNFERIYDDAALTFMEWMKSATAAATYSGQITLCAG